LILFGKRRKIDVCSWEIDSLLGGNLAVVEAPNSESLVVDDFQDFE